MSKRRTSPRGGDRKRPEGAPQQAPLAARAAAPPGQQGFPIVAIGSSAGGLEALQSFFLHISRDPGMAFVVLSHLDPSHASALPEIMRRHTNLQVLEIGGGEQVEADKVYVLPPNRDLTIEDGRLLLVEPHRVAGAARPIDHFFEALADDQGPRAICVVLSGMGSDGTSALKRVKDRLGTVVVQQPESAKFEGMPRSAVDSGLADVVLPVEEIPPWLEQAKGLPKKQGRRPEPEAPPWDTDWLQEVLGLLRDETGHDFSHYKLSTVGRRIQRRMGLLRIDDPAGYLEHLRRSPKAIRTLFDDLLIGVTGFFRDQEAFSSLEKAVAVSLRAARPNSPFRVWVPACSTGEEAYSLAMVLMDSLRKSRRSLQLQVFATDVDTDAVEKARAGAYAEEKVRAEIGPARVERYFTPVGGAYRIRKEVRDRITFSAHDALKDPPFIRLDLISCRNLMIYLDSDLQKRLLLLFHYSLNPEGLLFLGSSESILGSMDLFAVEEGHTKLFRRKAGVAPHRPRGDLALAAPPVRSAVVPEPRPQTTSIRPLAERELLSRFAPPSVIVDESGEILFVHGRTGGFLEPAPGEPNMNVLTMAREGLKAELKAAIREAARRRVEVVRKGLFAHAEGPSGPLDLTVRPLEHPPKARPLFVITFEMAPVSPRATSGGKRASSRRALPSREAALQRELVSTRENLQSTIEELEAANEELRSANEETQSVNEELQSTNEELETTREEQQSLNEELISVNAELQDRLVELGNVNDDMKNLLDSLEVPTLFVDRQLRIKRFTNHSPKVANLIPGDIGRPLEHVVTNLENVDLAEHARAALLEPRAHEIEVKTRDGHWYLLRALPYRTLEDDLEGVVLTFLDIHSLRTARDQLDTLNRQLEEQRRFQADVIDTLRESVLVLDSDSRIVTVNKKFCETFGETAASIQGRPLFELGEGQWGVPGLKELLDRVIPEDRVFEGFRVEHTFPQVGKKVLILSARKILATDSRSALLLLAIETASDAPPAAPAG